MRFGKSKKEADEEPSRGGGGGDFIRNLKEGTTTFRILQEQDEWKYYWEHFNPAGFSFPCSNEEDCPGCTSEIEKMKKVSRKIAFNALHSFNGQEYVDVFKVGPMVADKLENRIKRFDTITDRDYTITKYKTSGDRWDFEVEGEPPTPVDLHKQDWKDIEALLQMSWDEAWGDGAQAQANRLAMAKPPVRATIARTPAPEEPPFEQEKEYSEATLRAMELDALVALIRDEMDVEPPSTLTSSGAVVDWLLDMQS